MQLCLIWLFWSGFIPINGVGWIYPTLAAISAIGEGEQECWFEEGGCNELSEVESGHG